MDTIATDICPICKNRNEECVCCPECGHVCLLDQGESFCPVCGQGVAENQG